MKGLSILQGDRSARCAHHNHFVARRINHLLEIRRLLLLLHGGQVAYYLILSCDLTDFGFQCG